MAAKKTTDIEEAVTAEETAVTEGSTELVTLSKTQLDTILAQLEETNKKVEELTEQASKQPATKQEIQQAKEKDLLEQIERANSDSEEQVEVYIDKGSLKSNKNLEVNACGRQFIIPKGQTVKVPKYVKEVIDNADKQMEEALHLQDQRAEEAQKAIEEGRL